MHYVKEFIINGVDTKQVACIELQGVPNAATEGAVGVLGMDMSSPTHDVYRCVAVNGSIYTWELLSAGMSIVSSTITGEGGMSMSFPYDSLLLPKRYLIKCGDLIIDSEGYLYQISSIGADSCDATYTGTHIGSAGGKTCKLIVTDDGKLQLVTESGAVWSSVDYLLADGDTIYRDPATGNGTVIGVKTINDTILKFFVGTQSEYDALTDIQKQDLFALITDDVTKDEIWAAIEKLQADHKELTESLADGSFVVKEAEHGASADKVNAPILNTSLLEKALTLKEGVHHFRLEGSNYTGGDLPSYTYANLSSATVYVRYAGTSVVVELHGAVSCPPHYNICDDGVWKGWKTIIDSTNIANQSVSHATTADRAEIAEIADKAYKIAAYIDDYANNNLDGYLVWANSGGGEVYPSVLSELRYNPYTKTLSVPNLKVNGNITNTDVENVTHAETADKATKDGNGNNIVNTYAPIKALTEGTLVPLKATQAVQDGLGRAISDTYPTIESLTDPDRMIVERARRLSPWGSTVQCTITNGVGKIYSELEYKGVYILYFFVDWDGYPRCGSGLYVHRTNEEDMFGECGCGEIGVRIDNDLSVKIFFIADSVIANNCSGTLCLVKIADVAY